MKKSLKRLLAILYSICFLSPMITLSAINNTFQNTESTLVQCRNYVTTHYLTNEDLVTSDAHYILDFADNPIIVVECDPVGYFIFDATSGLCFEYNLHAVSPFPCYDDSVRYGGPTEYFKRSSARDGYTHTITNEFLSTIEAEQYQQSCESIHEELANKSLNFKNQTLSTNSSSQTRYTNHFINYSSFFMNHTSGFGYYSDDENNNNGYCGYIAANFVLKYWHYRDEITLPGNTWFINTTALTTQLISCGSNLGYGASTHGTIICSVINTFSAQNALPEGADFGLGVMGVTNEIDSSCPVILFGTYWLYNSGYYHLCAHAIIAYGYNTDENAGYTTYICHLGWEGPYSEVHICGLTNLYLSGDHTTYCPV